MAIDFPNSPVLNDTYAVGNTVYKWNGSVWIVSITGYGYTPNIDGGLYNSNYTGIAALDAGTP